MMETEAVTVDEGDPPGKKHEEAAGADAARASRAEARTACMDAKVLGWRGYRGFGRVFACIGDGGVRTAGVC